ncbi:MAG TPA: hypothetical protein VLH75_04960 [Longimicrobiales bacterium]|nr:hypothetical protein [Longimicrobiales bacterium]
MEGDPVRGPGRTRPRGVRAIVCLTATLALGTCGDEGPASAPGTLTATVVSPNGAEGAALVTLLGMGMGAVGPSEGRVFAEAHGDTVHVVVVNLAGGGLRFTVQVADTTKPPTGILVEVSGPDDRIRGLAGYRLELRP